MAGVLVGGACAGTGRPCIFVRLIVAADETIAWSPVRMLCKGLSLAAIVDLDSWAACLDTDTAVILESIDLE
jgi:hypothetical protein